MKNTKKLILLSLLSILGISGITAQDNKNSNPSDTIKSKVGETKNVMLNASADNGPRAVNIGLPKSVGGTVILENGLPVTYDFMGQSPVTLWRQDASISKFEVLNVANTALFASDVGVSVSTYTNRGTETFKGVGGFTTNSFGLLRGEAAVSGPIKNGFYYSLSAFVNLDPGTFRSNVSTFLDKTQIYKGVLNKKYRRGQIGVQYKYAYSESLNLKNSPYIYREDGKVDKLPGFRIGRDSYIEQSGKVNAIDPLTGKPVEWDAMADGASRSHVIDLFGDHKLNDNGLILDYTVRYQHAKSGNFYPYISSINQGISHNEAPEDGNKRYFYADKPDSPYDGLVQNSMMIFAPSSVKQTTMARFEVSKKSDKHHWMLGFHNWHYKVQDATSATYGHQFEVAPNPRALGYDQYKIKKDADGNPILVNGKEVGEWVRMTDEHGNKIGSYNNAMQYYSGTDNKMALVATEKWNINDKFTVDAGARFEWQRLDGKWYTAEDRKRDGTNWVSGNKSKVKKDWYNFTATANITYKAFKNFGFLADLMYIQQSGTLSLYAGADDPKVEKGEIPGFSGGIYFNHPMIQVVSKMTMIKRTNFKNNSTFNKDIDGKGNIVTQKQTNGYDVSTIGWTTDLLFKPFKGFDLHMLLTLQNPKYKNYEFEVFGEKFSNSNNVARSVSKTLIEIDPSYTYGRFKVWASARYFSKEYANYPNTLIFASRWETFAGINFKYDKYVDFGISAVNLFNQSGAQGSISGTNTTTPEQAKALYNKPLCGTYIRPFTIEFKTKVRF